MDVLADMLIRIKNAQAVKKNSVLIPYSRLKMDIAEKLVEKGFLKSVERKGKKNKKVIELALLYDENGHPIIKDVRRISKLSKRIYLPARKLRLIYKKSGTLFLSTTKGILTGEDAIKQKVGGEVLFMIR